MVLMTQISQGSYICIDVETTGLSFTEDRIIQVGIAIFHRWKCVHRGGFYVANTSVPNAGFSINGITDEQIASGQDPLYAFTVVSSILHKVPRIVLAYNAPFDLTFLAQEFRRYELVYNFNLLKIIDPLVIHRHYRPFTPAPYSRLIHVAALHGVPIENAHDAISDAEASGHVFASQRLHYGIRGEWKELHNRQQLWHTKWADEYLSYHRSRGNDRTVIPWPYDKENECFLKGEQSLLWQES